jgi:5-(carboxyamino)imidazole ribonucleotide synthase
VTATRHSHLTTGRVGMVGAGQLARMTQRAAIDLGVHLEVLAASVDDPAVTAGAGWRLGAPDDADALHALARDVDVVTLDHELVPNEHLRALVEAGHTLAPTPAALAFGQDKHHARQELGALGFPVPAFAEVRSGAEVAAFAEGEGGGWPLVLKAATGGYDGRGVEVVVDAEDADEVLRRGGTWIAEAHVDIAMELAVVVARRPSGETAAYPVVETVQRDGICVELVLPARVDTEVADRAVALATDIVTAIGGTGIVATELFVTGDGGLVVNELALRPHNSGHVTIEGAVTSQFHQHLRAVLDWPLGSTTPTAPVAVTVNLLGGREPTDLAERLPSALAIPGVAVHLYGKVSRPARKIGHVTALGDDADEALARARAAASRLVDPAPAPDAAGVVAGAAAPAGAAPAGAAPAGAASIRASAEAGADT